MATRRRRRRRESKVEQRAGLHPSPLLGLRYPLTVAAIAAPLLAIYFYPYAENGVIATGIQSYLSGYASIAAAVIGMFDPNVAIHGDLIAGRAFSMRIVKTCDAMDVNILLVAALAGFPMPIRRRLVAVLASVLCLVLLNVLRLCMLYWLGAHAPTWFDRARQTLAPLFMVACALAIFIVATTRKRPDSSGSSALEDATP
jgi:exosortase/archaeosortase family protein